MEKERISKTAILLRGQRGRLVRDGRALGRVEKWRGAMDQDMFDPDNDSKHRDLSDPRPNACDP